MATVALCGSATDRFYIEDFAILRGEPCTVSIMLDNDMPYTAFQSDLYLPEGITATDFALTNRKNANHTFSTSTLPDGGIRLLSYSIMLRPYEGNSGALVTFKVTASDSFEGNATLALRNSLFTTVAGVEIPFSDEECTVSLLILGDVNNDGNVTITDVTALITHLLGYNIDNYNAANADVNHSGDVTIADVTALINLLLSSRI